MKIYMVTDLEGVAGVTGFEDRRSPGHDSHDNWNHRQRMRRLLTGEVNAAVDGLFEAGATQVIVNDSHGAGYTIDFENLDPRAQIYHGHERPVLFPMLDETCDATILVGAHAKASTPGATAYHTMSKDVKDWNVNGVSFGEMGLQALVAGHFDVPKIFVSGDWHACREIGELIQGVEAVAVKRGLSRLSAVSWSHPKACEMIREGVKRAMARVNEIKPVKFDPPLVLRDERYSETWTRPSSNADVKIIDHNTREIRADGVLDLLNKMYGYPTDYKHASLADMEAEA